MRRSRGFTIIELLIVVVIIGVLATMAVPQFQRAVERAKVAKAKNMMALILKGANMIRSQNNCNQYDGLGGCAGDVDATIDNVVNYVELGTLVTTEGDTDNDWTYATTRAANAMTVTATRNGGGIIGGNTLVVNENGEVQAASTLPAWAR